MFIETVRRACAEKGSVTEPRTLGHRGLRKEPEEPAEEVRGRARCGGGISGECCVQGAREKGARALVSRVSDGWRTGML